MSTQMVYPAQAIIPMISSINTNTNQDDQERIQEPSQELSFTSTPVKSMKSPALELKAVACTALQAIRDRIAPLQQQLELLYNDEARYKKEIDHWDTFLRACDDVTEAAKLIEPHLKNLKIKAVYREPRIPKPDSERRTSIPADDVLDIFKANPNKPMTTAEVLAFVPDTRAGITRTDIGLRAGYLVKIGKLEQSGPGTYKYIPPVEEVKPLQSVIPTKPVVVAKPIGRPKSPTGLSAALTRRAEARQAVQVLVAERAEKKEREKTRLARTTAVGAALKKAGIQ